MNSLEWARKYLTDADARAEFKIFSLLLLTIPPYTKIDQLRHRYWQERCDKGNNRFNVRVRSGASDLDDAMFYVYLIGQSGLHDDKKIVDFIKRKFHTKLNNFPADLEALTFGDVPKNVLNESPSMHWAEGVLYDDRDYFAAYQDLNSPHARGLFSFVA